MRSFRRPPLGQQQVRKLSDGDKLPSLKRFASFRSKGEAASAKLDKEARTLELTFSSEYPVERWYGIEVLSHDAGAADLGRLNDGAPLLFNHNWDDIRGVVEKAWIGDDKKGRAVVRFAKTPAGDMAMSMVEDDVLRNVSFMYQVDQYKEEGDGGPDDDDAERTYTATRWKAYEISLVSIPADPTVGVGRTEPGQATRSVEVIRRTATPAAPSAASAAINLESSMNWRILAQQLGLKLADGADEAAYRTAVLQALSLSLTADDAAVRSALDKRLGDVARQSERERIVAIEQLGQRHKLPRETIDKLIKEGRSIEEARGIVLDHLSESGGGRPVANFDGSRVDMSAAEAKRYSVIRAVRAALSGDWSDAGFEREVSLTIAKQQSGGREGKRQNSFFIPTNLPFAPDMEHARAWMHQGSPLARMLEQRAIYQVGTAGQGGNLVMTELLASSFIEVLRNQSVVLRLGARLLSGLVGNVDIPRQITQTSTFWVGESGAITEAEATFDKVSLRPKTIAALSKMSRLMLLQATPAIEMLAREDLLAVMALGLDLGALSGSGSSNQPTGIVNQSGVGSVVGGTNGANLTFDHLISLYTAPLVANAPQDAMGFAFNAKVRGYLATQKATTNAYIWQPQGGGVASAVPDTIQGYPYLVSNQLRATLTKGTSSGICSELIYGNWRELLIGEWGVTEIAVNPYDSTGFTQGDVLIRAMQTLDVQCRHGASFAVMSDALTPGF